MLSGFPFDNEVAKLVAFDMLFELIRGRSLSSEAQAHLHEEQPAPSTPKVSSLRKLFARCTPVAKTLRFGVVRAVRLFF